MHSNTNVSIIDEYKTPNSEALIKTYAGEGLALLEIKKIASTQGNRWRLNLKSKIFGNKTGGSL